MKPDQEHNRRAWDAQARARKAHTKPVTERDFQNPRTILDECRWLDQDLRGRKVLCLAAGGGRHGVLFAAMGLEVTVVDLSSEMLALDRTLAAQRGLHVRCVQASMDDLSMFSASSFDMVMQPVSTCYLPDILAVYREVARVTSPSGIYISQHKQPASLQGDAVPTSGGYLLREPYYRSGPLPALGEGFLHREAGTLEFLHRWEDLLGGLCRSGFVIEDLVEPRHADSRAEPGSFKHRSHFLPPYVTLKARRTNARAEADAVPELWIPSGSGRPPSK